MMSTASARVQPRGTEPVGLVADDVGLSYLSRTDVSVPAIVEINLTIGTGEFVVIIGPSGCGKSTLLQCMGGLLRPTTGQVYLRGAPVLNPMPGEASFVFQDYSLFPWRTAVDNAAIGLKFAGMPKKRRRQKALESLELLGIGHSAESYPSELSGGMQQRVAIARALVMEPTILLMDEPFGALDEQSRRTIGLEMSAALTGTGKTIVMVTHSLDEAIFWADRIIVMTPGPGRVAEEIRIPEKRPRTAGFLTSSCFERVRGQLLQLLGLQDSAHVTGGA